MVRMEEFPDYRWRLPISRWELCDLAAIAAHLQPRGSPPIIAAGLASSGHLGPVTR